MRFRVISSIVLGVAAALTLASCDSRASVDAYQIVDTLAQSEVLITGASDESEALCDGPPSCTQVVVTDQLSVWRFASKADANGFASTLLGPLHVSDYIVLEFVPGKLTAEQQRLAAGIADGANTSD